MGQEFVTPKDVTRYVDPKRRLSNYHYSLRNNPLECSTQG